MHRFQIMKYAGRWWAIDRLRERWTFAIDWDAAVKQIYSWCNEKPGADGQLPIM